MVQSFITKQQFATPPLRKNEEKEEVNQQLTRSICEPRIEFERRNFNFKKLKAFGMSDCSKKIGYHPIPSRIPIPMRHTNEYTEYAPKVQKMKATTILKPIIIKRKNCISIGKKRGACNGKKKKLPHQTFKCSNPNFFQQVHKTCKKVSFDVKNDGRKPTKVRGPQIWNGSSSFNSHILRCRKQKLVQQSVYRNDKLQAVFNMILVAIVIGLLKKCWTSTIIERLFVIVEDIRLYVVTEFSMNDALWITVICMINFIIACVNFKKGPKEISVKSDVLPKQLLFKFVRAPVPIFCHQIDTIEVISKANVNSHILHQHYNFCLICKNMEDGCHEFRQILTTTPKKEIISMLMTYNLITHKKLRNILRTDFERRKFLESSKENNIPKNEDKNLPLNINVNEIIKAFDQLKFEQEDIKQNLDVNGFNSKVSQNKQPNINPEFHKAVKIQSPNEEEEIQKALGKLKKITIDNVIDNCPVCKVPFAPQTPEEAKDDHFHQCKDSEFENLTTSLKQLQLKKVADVNNNDSDNIGTIFMFTAKKDKRQSSRDEAAGPIPKRTKKQPTAEQRKKMLFHITFSN
uniref:UBZ4-type domain-containing protein n=1 Tax=Panagrolaimus davidi TaxID=227884 RepID=A0A914Q075_9BILA